MPGRGCVTYPVQCQCGAVRQVAATLAGSTIECECGRTIAVPSLSRLKEAGGESAMSAEVRIEQMLKRDMLPQETNCLVCESPTKDVAYCWTTCERAKVEQPTDWELNPWTLFSLVFGFLWLSFRKVNRETVEGRDLRFRLPLRVCASCRDLLREPLRLKETLLDVPVYAELLQKYPDADVSLDLGLSGLRRRTQD